MGLGQLRRESLNLCRQVESWGVFRQIKFKLCRGGWGGLSELLAAVVMDEVTSP